MAFLQGRGQVSMTKPAPNWKWNRLSLAAPRLSLGLQLCSWIAMWEQQSFHGASLICKSLRGAWRDHCFPEPFSWFLHETGLESLKITSALCFLLKCRRKDSKKAKEHRQFRGVLGRWRTAPIDRTTFNACQRCRKNAVLAVFFFSFGVSFGEWKPFVNSNASF